MTRFELPGIESPGQGATRKISELGVYHVALIQRLVATLGLPIEAACALAIRLLAGQDGGTVAIFDAFELRFDRRAFIASIDARIAEAIETVVLPRRGRPPAKD